MDDRLLINESHLSRCAKAKTMKDLFRYIFLLIACLVFAFGMFILVPTEPIETATAQVMNSTNVNTNAAPHRPPIIGDFVPEFVDLPNFGELDSDVALGANPARLVAISEFESSDEPWPSYSRSDLSVRSGETWLGLYASKGLLHLAPTKVSRTPRKGYIGPGAQPYDWLKYERKGELIFLVKDIPELKSGKIKTLFLKEASAEDSSLEGGYKRSFQMGDNNYVLRVTTGLQRDGGRVNVLMLESGGKSQMVTFNLYYKDHNTLYNIIGDLIWAGDMDGDGKLDLYFSDHGFEKGGFGSNLYLSSPAKEGNLVEYVAGFSSAGC